jgi:hypothetical protein
MDDTIDFVRLDFLVRWMFAVALLLLLSMEHKWNHIAAVKEF